MSDKSLFDQPDLLITDVIANNARVFKNKVVAWCGDESLTWAQFDERTNRVANALLGLGVGKGDKVCLVMGSSIAMFELIFGVIKSGGVLVAVSTSVAPAALAAMIDNSDAKLVFCDRANHAVIGGIRKLLPKVPAEGFLAIGFQGGDGWVQGDVLIEAAHGAAPDVAIAMSDSINIVYSSGSTGTPKGIEQSHLARHTYSLGFGPAYQIDRFSTSICATPLYTNGTWVTMFPTVYFGGTVVLMPRFTPEDFLALVQRHGGSHAFLTITQFLQILDMPDAGRHADVSLKSLIYGGQQMPQAAYEALVKRFPHAGLYEMYGLAEGLSCIAGPGDRKLGKVGSGGLPIFGADLRIIDDAGNEVATGELGEIVGYGPTLMKGYYRNPEATRDAIWLGPKGRTYIRTGDLGRVDEDGYVYVAGRIKDMIKSGGLNIFASDLENVLARHEDVQEVAVIGIPHEKWLETPLALVIRRPGARATESQMRDWANERLSKFQRVAAVEFRDDFPRAAHDKVVKKALREPYWAAASL